jgi:hypothetical protein
MEPFTFCIITAPKNTFQDLDLKSVERDLKVLKEKVAAFSSGCQPYKTFFCVTKLECLSLASFIKPVLCFIISKELT